MKKAFVVLLSAVLFMLSSCDPDNVYREYKDIKQFVWTREYNIPFKVEIKENNLPYNVKIGFRHMAQIRKSSIKVVVKITSPSGKISENPYTISIRDAQGFPIGETMGDISDIETIIEAEHVFAETGVYAFEVRQDEKEDELAGMMEVGVVIDKVVPKK